MDRLNNDSDFDESGLNSEVNDSSRSFKTSSLVMITSSLILVTLVGLGNAASQGIKSPQDLAVNDHQYQEFSICLEDLDQIKQAVTGSLIKQQLTNGLGCLEKLSISLQDNLRYQNLQSIEQELADQADPSSVFLYQDKLSSLVKELDWNLLDKTTIGLVTNTIIDSLWVMLLLMGFLVYSLGMYVASKVDEF